MQNCGKEFYPTYNLKNFCSFSCRKQYRKSYKRLKEPQRRASLKNVDKIHRYVNTCFNTSKPQNGFKRTTKDIFDVEYGSQENYQLARTCCNWEMKQKEGYGEYAMVGGIIDHFGWSKIKREKSSSSFGQTYFGVVFSDAFTTF